MRLIGPWIDVSHKNQLQDSLASILTKALEVSGLLRRQRASWCLKFPGSAERSLSDPQLVMFNDRAMRDVNSSETHKLKTVKIFVTPGLFKTGNMDGKLYEEGESVVTKAEVWCTT